VISPIQPSYWWAEVDEVFEVLKKRRLYHWRAPVSLVTSTLLIWNMQILLYMWLVLTFLEKRMLSIANVYKEQKLPNACFLMIRAQLRATAMVMDTEWDGKKTLVQENIWKAWYFLKIEVPKKLVK
jgi:hypothetical protein